MTTSQKTDLKKNKKKNLGSLNYLVKIDNLYYILD